MRIIKWIIAVIGISCAWHGQAQEHHEFSELEAYALVAAIHDLEVELRNLEGDGPEGILDEISRRVEEAKAVLKLIVESYDENGNGRIDSGPEWDAFVGSLKEFALDYIDRDGNGQVDDGDISVIIEIVTLKMKALVMDRICNSDALLSILPDSWVARNCPNAE